MVRRRSLALSAAGAMDGQARSSVNGFGASVEKSEMKNNDYGRWSDVREYNGQNAGKAGYRGSMVKDPNYEDEERLEKELELAKRNSRDQEMMVRRAS
jgi:hypothetical protein